MAHTDLERVETDLAAMKAVCVEPAIPTEEIVPNLILAGVGVLLVAETFLLPRLGSRATVIMALVLGAAAYIALEAAGVSQRLPAPAVGDQGSLAAVIGAVRNRRVRDLVSVRGFRIAESRCS